MIYLASASPRRAQLLEQIGISFTLLVAQAHENVEELETPFPQEDPKSYVQRVCLLKLDAAKERLHSRHLPLKPILCADTTVSIDGKILGKPQDSNEATWMLRQLSGNEHHVFTAVSVCAPDGAVRSVLSSSLVRFKNLSEHEIKDYIHTQEPFGKAGAYAIQGHAAAFITHISGSYSGIMGLPLFETAQLLQSL